MKSIKKGRRSRGTPGKGVVTTLKNKLPYELHLPSGSQYCGSGIKLAKRLARGDPGKNPLDVACKQQDIVCKKITI